MTPVSSSALPRRFSAAFPKWFAPIAGGDDAGLLRRKKSRALPRCVRALPKLAFGFGAALMAMVSCTDRSEAQVRGNNNYYDEHKAVACSVTDCTLLFASLPSNVVFTNVSCQIEIGAPIRSVSFSVASAPGGASITNQKFMPTFVTFANARYYYGFNLPVRFLMGTGRFPRISVTAYISQVSPTGIECTIIGTPDRSVLTSY